MTNYPFASVAKQASTEAVRDRFSMMVSGNRMCPRKAPGVMAGLEGYQSRATKM